MACEDKCCCAKCKDNTQPLYLHGRCHISSPSVAMYDSIKKVLIIRCAECMLLVARIRVDDDPLQKGAYQFHPIWVCYDQEGFITVIDAMNNTAVSKVKIIA